MDVDTRSKVGDWAVTTAVLGTAPAAIVATSVLSRQFGSGPATAREMGLAARRPGLIAAAIGIPVAAAALGALTLVAPDRTAAARDSMGTAAPYASGLSLALGVGGGLYVAYGTGQAAHWIGRGIAGFGLPIMAGSMIAIAGASVIKGASMFE